MSKNSVHYLDLKVGDIIISNGKVFKVNEETMIEPLEKERDVDVYFNGRRINIVSLDAKNIIGNRSFYC